MKTLITLSSILAAGTLAANAATPLTTWASSTTNSANNKATSSGFVFNLSSERLTTTSVPESVSLEDWVKLDSIVLKWTTSDTGLVTNNGFVLTDSSNKILAISDTEGDVVKNGSVTIDFDDVKISSSTDYRVWFTSGKITTKTVGEIIESTDVKNNTVGISFATYTTADNTGLEVINNSDGTMWDTKYAPVVTINTTAIPEPSAFGILAGIGALALAGTRRRRKVK